MIKRMLTNCNDETCPSCVIAGNLIFISHQAGACDKNDIKYQMRGCFNLLKKTLELTGLALNDMVQINLYLNNIDDFNEAREVFYEFFDINHMPARTTTTTDFLDKDRLCMLDGVAYKDNKFLYL